MHAARHRDGGVGDAALSAAALTRRAAQPAMRRRHKGGGSLPVARASAAG